MAAFGRFATISASPFGLTERAETGQQQKLAASYIHGQAMPDLSAYSYFIQG
jgi:hypothetical protein